MYMSYLHYPNMVKEMLSKHFLFFSFRDSFILAPFLSPPTACLLPAGASEAEAVEPGYKPRQSSGSEGTARSPDEGPHRCPGTPGPPRPWLFHLSRGCSV